MSAFGGQIEASAFDQTTWLRVKVDKKLRTEGKQLLKVLYYKSSPLHSLSEIEEPSDLYRHHATLSTGGPSSGNPAQIQEYEKVTKEDCLALFIHRLSVLVPRPTKTDPGNRLRELGVQDCLDSLPIPKPCLEASLFQESRLLECLVGAYVDMTPQQRNALKTELGRQVGVHPDNANVFEIFCQLFQEKYRRCESIVDTFADALCHAQPAREVFENLTRDLNRYGIPHNDIPIPKSDPISEEDKRNTELQSLIDRRLETTCITSRCTKKRIFCLLALCVPIVLGVLVIVVTMPVFSTHPKSGEYSLENSGYSQMRCPSDFLYRDSGVMPIRVGTVNSFWYDSVSISQFINQNDHYYAQTVTYFVLPSEHLHVRRVKYSCPDEADSKQPHYGDKIVFDQLYLLKYSTLNFTTICIKSTSEEYRGVLNLTICDNKHDYTVYITDLGTHCLQQYRLYVDANTSNCTGFYFFTAPHDGFYYITTIGPNDKNATVTSYKVDVDLRYLNSSDWANKNIACSSKGNPQPKSCRIQIGKKGWFPPKNYDIVATITASGDLGKLTIDGAATRSQVYIIPAVAAIAVIVVGLMCVVCAGASVCAADRIGKEKRSRRKDDYTIMT